MTKEKKPPKAIKPSDSANKETAGSVVKPPKVEKVAKKPQDKTAETTKLADIPPQTVLNATAANPAEITLEDEEIILTDAEGRRYCRVSDCDQFSSVDGYCRYHYLYFWKKIQVRKKILADGKLERYIEELTSRYVDKFIEILRKDTRTEKDFLAAVQELELDDAASSAQDEDEAKTYIEEISGVATEGAGRDDEGY